MVAATAGLALIEDARATEQSQTKDTPALSPAALDNVLVFRKEWAAKILAGTKMIEIRTSPPPTYSSGVYGVAVAGVPDVVVGRVRVSSCSPRLSVEEVQDLRVMTQVPDHLVAAYLGRARSGFCWYLDSACAFERAIPFYSRGQRTKGAPRKRQQSEVEVAVLRSAAAGWTEEQCLCAFRLWRITQRRCKQERKAKRLSFY